MSPRLIMTHHSNVVATVVVMKQQQLHYTQETHTHTPHCYLNVFKIKYAYFLKMLHPFIYFLDCILHCPYCQGILHWQRKTQ